MKDYKVGDEVLVKGKVYGIDDSGLYSYLVDFDKPFGNSTSHYWVRDNYIVDELPTAEPVKPVLPKGVADELETTKKLNVTFDGYIMRVIDNHYLYTNSHTFWMNSDDGVIKILMDAWYNGYTIEQVPRYKVYVTGTNKQYMYVKRGELAKAHNKKATPITPQSIGNYITAGVSHRDLYWFTDEEITKFNLQDCEKGLVADD